MADSLPAVIAFAIALASPVLVWPATRPRPESWRGYAALFFEVFAVVIVAAILTRYAAVPALQWLSVHVL